MAFHLKVTPADIFHSYMLNYEDNNMIRPFYVAAFDFKLLQRPH